MAEGARLESVFRGNSNLGSNPSLSAIEPFPKRPKTPNKERNAKKIMSFKALCAQMQPIALEHFQKQCELYYVIPGCRSLMVAPT